MVADAQTSSKLKWIVDDLECLPDNGSRYEIIEGELHVTRALHWQHQSVSGRIYAKLLAWSTQTNLGEPAMTPGVVFSPEKAVIPDVVWVSRERLAMLLDQAGHLTGAPELMVEVLSEAPKDKKRDRTAKLNLYSNEGVLEYWIADREQRLLEVYRRENGVLTKGMTLYSGDTLTSPLLPEFICEVGLLFS
ncbi:MAG: Uma2 family endonuclease [Cyanobacteria bacterium P01_D01_bin.128]